MSPFCSGRVVLFSMESRMNMTNITRSIMWLLCYEHIGSIPPFSNCVILSFILYNSSTLLITMFSVLQVCAFPPKHVDKLHPFEKRDIDIDSTKHSRLFGSFSETIYILFHMILCSSLCLIMWRRTYSMAILAFLVFRNTLDIMPSTVSKP